MVFHFVFMSLLLGFFGALGVRLYLMMPLQAPVDDTLWAVFLLKALGVLALVCVVAMFFFCWRRECMKRIRLSFVKGVDHDAYFIYLPELVDMVYEPVHWLRWSRNAWKDYAVKRRWELED